MLFNGRLNKNDVYASMYNSIISLEVVSDILNSTQSDSIVSMCKVDGGRNGDQKLYTDYDIYVPQEWLGDAEAANLLSIRRNNTAKTQTIIANVFKMVWITTGGLKVKQMGTLGDPQLEAGFKASLRQSKKIEEKNTLLSYIGTTKSKAVKNTITIPVNAETADLTGLEKKQAYAMVIADSIADLAVDLGDTLRDYNDYGYIRSYDDSDYVVIWNSKKVNRINKIALPTIFHKEGLVDKFNEYVMPERFFGDVIEGSGTVADGEEIHTLVAFSGDVNGVHYELFPGDVLPVGYTYEDGTAYKINDKVICKVLSRKSIPLMSGFEEQTSFYNSRSTTENTYLIYSRNTLEYRYGLPFLTVVED